MQQSERWTLYLTIDEAMAALSCTYQQLLECVTVGHLHVYWISPAGANEIEEVHHIADLLAGGPFHPGLSAEERDWMESRQAGLIGDLPDWRFLKSECDPAILQLKAKPKTSIQDQRAEAILKAIVALDFNPKAVAAKGPLEQWCSEHYPELFTSSHAFPRAWKHGSGKKLWRITPTKIRS